MEVQFSIPGTAEQGSDRGWLSRDTNMQIGIYGSSELAASKIGSSSLWQPVIKRAMQKEGNIGFNTK